MGKEPNRDLFGDVIEENALLKDEFIEPPFSVIDTKTGRWQTRRQLWLNMGIKSELGRDAECLRTGIGEGVINKNTGLDKYGRKPMTGQSIFDPALCELMYHWFCPKEGKILDPFAGGSVRGVVANYLGYYYTGIELSQRQVESNRKQAEEIIKDNLPIWWIGDTDQILDEEKFLEDIGWSNKYDFIFSCPPYLDLEVYSDDPNDLSTMNDSDFEQKYYSIVYKSTNLLKSGGYACFVVGDIRDKKNGYYRDFIGMTKRVFKRAGLGLYNEAVLLNSLGTAMLRVSNTFKSKKLVKVHQNILIFKKP